MALGAFIRGRDGAYVPPQEELVPRENRAIQQKREETPVRKKQSDEQEKSRKRQQNQLNEQTQDIQSSDHRHSSSGFQKEQQSMLGSRRQEIAKKSRVEVPVTRLGSNQTMISKADINGQSRNLPLMSPPQPIETLRATEEPTHRKDDVRPFYETDAENIDNTTTLSNETQSKDDERKPRGTEFNPNEYSHGQLVSNLDTVMADPNDERHLQRYPVNRHNGSYVEGDSTGDEEEEGEEDGDTEDGQSYETSSQENVTISAAILDGPSRQASLSATDMAYLQKEAVVAKSFQGLPTSSRVPLQPYNGIVIPATNQPTYRHGLTSPYPSTASSEAHDYAPNPQVRNVTPPQNQGAISRYHVGHHSATRSNQPPKENKVGKGQQTRNKPIDQQGIRYHSQQNRANLPTQMSTQVRHDSPMRPNPQQEEQLMQPMYDHSETGEEDIAADPIDEIFSARSPGNLEDPLTPTQKRPLELDYEPEQLSNMSYADLKNEPFDQDSRAPTDILPDNLVAAPLAHRLEYINEQAKRHDASIEQQRAFFSSLPIDEYEECGDLIVNHFAAIITKFKDARREKRKVAMAFEEEVARREEGVRGKKDAIERDMGRLRKAGEDVVKGKGA